jgi:hypothetical protein
MIDLSKYETEYTTKALQFFRRDWENLIIEYAKETDLKLNFYYYKIIVYEIVNKIFEYMDMNDIEFIFAINFESEEFKMRKVKDEIKFQVDLELSYQLDKKYNLKGF